MADPTFDAVYVGSTYNGSVTVPSGRSANKMIAFVSAFYDAAGSISMSGWTQIAIDGVSSGTPTVRGALFERSYAAGTYSATLGGSLGDYLLTIYTVNDAGSIGASDTETANNENPVSCPVSATASGNSLAILAACFWSDCPAAGDVTGTWTSQLGPPTLGGVDSEARSWYGTRTAGTVSSTVTKTLRVQPDTGVVLLVIVEGSSGTQTISPSSVSSGEAHGSATASASGAATVSPSGVATAQAFGTAALSGSATTVSPSSVATAEAHGTPALSASGAGTIAPGGVASSLAFGSATASGSGAGTVSPSGIATALAFGSASLVAGTRFISPHGRPPRCYVFSNSLGAGYPGSDYALVGPSGLAALFPDVTFVNLAYSGENTAGLIGRYASEVDPTIQPGDWAIIWEGVNDLDTTDPAGASANFATLAGLLHADGAVVVLVGCLPYIWDAPVEAEVDALNALLRSEHSFVDYFLDIDTDNPQFRPAGTVNGNTRFSDHIHLSNLGYTEVRDYIGAFLAIVWSGTRSREYVAKPSASPTGAAPIAPSAIASLLAFGTTAASGSGAVNVSPSGVATAQAFGTQALSPSGAAPIAPSSVASAQAFGTAALTPGGVTVSPSSVASGEAHGSPTVSPSGAATVAPSGVTTSEAVSTPSLLAGAFLAPSGIASAETFGASVVSGSGTATAVGPSGVATSETVPGPALTPGGVTVSPSSIASALAFGTASLASGGATISPSAIASLEQHGTPALAGTGNAPLGANGIGTAEAFGGASLVPGGVTVSLTGIATSEAWGTPALTVGAAVISPSSIVTGELFGLAAVGGAGSAFVSPSSILTREAFGLLTLSSGALLRIVNLRSNWTHTPGRDLLAPTWSRNQ